MKKYLKPLAVALLLGAGTAALYAIPAKKGVRTYTQPDGTTVEVELVGDEYAHMYLTPDGYPLAEKDGTLYYAGISADGRIEASGERATSIKKRSAAAVEFLATVDKALVGNALRTRAEMSPLRKVQRPGKPGMSRAPQGPGLAPDANFPVTGSPHVLVILVEYSNVPMTLNNAHDYFTRMMSERGFSDYGGTGSALDFFDENSCGQFTPIIDVYGPVKLPNTRAYYGGNDSSGDDKNPAQMVVDACEALDGEVDFSKYDTDGDGMIDNVFVFYAGRGEADGGSPETVWPHAWYVQSGAGLTHYFDGVLLDRYACSNEWGAGRPDGVGTFIHEFSHVMGLPDLYATSYSSAFTPGEWSTMDYGPYNNDGCTPPMYSAYERYALGWVEPVEIDGPMSAVLRPIGENVCGIIKTGKTNEFFLVENRQQTSWDTYIPGHGMLVWHIDYNANVWFSNKVNNSATHQYVDIEEADNTKTDTSRAGDAFPGTSNVTSFTDDTRPSMKTWAGKGLGLPITNIAESAQGVITFDVAGGAPNAAIDTPTALEATETGIDGFTANWEAEEGMSYLLSVYTKDAAGNAVYSRYNRYNVGAVSSVKTTGLESDTQYYYTVTAISGFNMSEASNEIAVRTERPGIDWYATVSLPATGVRTDGFTANWEALPDATGYLLSVYELIAGDPLEFSTGFDDKDLPAGWSSPSYGRVGMSSYCGAAVPAVSISDGNYIQTADYGDIYSLSFWHRGTSGAASGSIVVSGRIGGEWTECRTFDVVTAVGGITLSTELPAGTSAVRITYKGAGTLRMDDVALTYGHSIARNPVAPYSAYNVGNVTSYDVDGLEEGKNYCYIVQATDGEKTSKESAEVRVTLRGNSGIGSVDAGALRVSASAGVLTVAGVDCGVDVAVYDIAGRTVGSGRGECAFGVGHGVYIVRAGGASVKVLVQ